MKDELLECFDDQGNIIHPRMRSEVCVEGSRRWHGVADAWLVNSDGFLLCAQRAPFVANNPNKWETLHGGHMKAGESFVQTVVSEVYQELGIKLSPGKLRLIEKGKSEDRMHIHERYVAIFDGRIKDMNFIDGEVVEAKWLLFEDYRKEEQLYPEKWCYGCSKENQLKILEWLKSQV